MSTSNCLTKLNYDPLPIDLKEKLIEFALEVHQKKIGLRVVANIVPTGESDVDTSKSDNNVFIYLLHPKLTKRIQEHYAAFFNEQPTLSTRPGRGVVVQVINGPLDGEEFNVIHPHTDPDSRPKTLMYILSPGGNNVKTTWYKIKNEKIDYKETLYENSNLYDYDLPIYSANTLDPIEDHIMEEDGWYAFNHSITHGVTNIESTRVILTCMLDYEKITAENKNEHNQEYLVKLLSDWDTLDCMK